MNRPGTPLSVASEKRTSMPGVIMAAHAIIGTVLRKFPLGGTLSYSNWTFQLLSAPVRRALGQASILGGRLHEVFSPGFAVHGRAREASLQVNAVSRPSAECLLAGACSDGPRSKSLTTRCRLGQRRRSRPSTGTDSW